MRPNNPAIKRLHFHVWKAIFDKFFHLNLQSKDISELKSALMKIWNDLSRPDLRGAQGARPQTSHHRGPPTKLFIFCFRS